MTHFTKAHVFILPHAEEYRQFYDLTLENVLHCLNAPDTQERLATGYYTAEKTHQKHRVYVYYYLALPLQASKDEFFAIVDFIGYTSQEDPPLLKKH